MKTIFGKINNFILKKKPINSDNSFDVHNKSESAATVKEFALGLSEIISTHGLTNVAVNDLLTLLRDTTQSLELPLCQKDTMKTGTEVENMRQISQNTLSEYLCDDLRDIPSDVCRHECMVFRGMQVDPISGELIDASQLIRCMVCFNPRFSKCAHLTCRTKNKSYDECNPFILKTHVNSAGIVINRGHSLAQRVPMKRVYYRSITGKLIQMYSLSLMRGFRGILSYDQTRIKRKGKIIDLLDGKQVKRQMQLMDEKYQRVKQTWNSKFVDMELHQCSLILTMCYDGVTNFKRKSDSMWPLLCSIGNCNPSHRAKVGAGMFLVLLHNASVGSGVESYMMKDMLTEELKKLEEGIFFTIPEQEGFSERHVFLQARLVYAHLDTKALEKVACIKLSNSLVGCTLCNLQRGVYRHCVHKCVYIGTRLPLHRLHKLRRCGQREFKKDKLRKRMNGEVIVEPRVSAKEYERLYYKGDASSTELIKKENAAVMLNDSAKQLPATFENPMR